MKQLFPALAKRSLALALALALLLSLCPVLPLTAKAAHTGEWTYKDTYEWIRGSFKTEDTDLVYEEGQSYDWSVVINPSLTPPSSANVVASIKDADGNVISEYQATVDGIARYTESVLCSAENFSELTADLEGTFTLTCQMLYKGAIFAQLVQTFSRVGEGAGGETTEAPEASETTAATEGEEENGPIEFKDGWTYKPNNEWIDGSFVSEDADLVFEGEQPYDWSITLCPALVGATVNVETSIVDADGNPVAEPVTNTVDVPRLEKTEIASCNDFPELGTDVMGTFTLTCTVKMNGTTFAQLVKKFSRVAEGEGGETPDTPVGPSVNNAYAKIDDLGTEVLKKNMEMGGYSWREDKTHGPYNFGITPNSGFYFWDVGNGMGLTFTLSPEFLTNFDGKATIKVHYIPAGQGTMSLIYHGAESNEAVAGTITVAKADVKRELVTAEFNLEDAVFTDVYGLGYSFVLRVTDSRSYIAGVEVIKATESESATYTLDLTSASEVADLVYYDEAPYDLSLDATTDGAIEVVNVSYTVSGGNLTAPLTENKTVALSKEGVNVLDAAWFNEKANTIGYGDFTLEVTMSNEGKELLSKTFTFSRKMTSILASELRSEIAELKNGILVFSEDVAMDLELFLKNRLAEPFNGTLTYTVSKDGAPLDGYNGLTVEITDLTESEIELPLPEAAEYGIYELAISVANGEGEEVHSMVYTFARTKAAFVSFAVSSATAGDSLVFVDEAAYDLMLALQKTDGNNEDLTIEYVVLNGSETVKSGTITENISATSATQIALDLAGVEGFGEFTLQLSATNTLGDKQEFFCNFSRIESIKSELTSESNADLVFVDDEAYDLKLSLQKMAGEDRVVTVNYTVVKGDANVKTGSIENVAITATAAAVDVDMTGVEGNGNFTISVALVDAEGNTIKTAKYEVIRKTSVTAELLHPSAITIGGKLTYIDHVPYDFGVSLQKPAGEAEEMTVNYVVVDAEGNEVTGSAKVSVGSVEAAVAALDLTGVNGYGTFKMTISVLDSYGNEVAATEFTFARLESILTQLTSDSNPDLVFATGDVYDLVLRLKNTSGSTEKLSVTYTITNENGDVLYNYKTPLNLGNAVVPAVINKFTDLTNFTTEGTFHFNLTIVDSQNRLREDVSYTFSRVALEGTVASAITSASSPELVFVPGGNMDMVLQIQKTDNVSEGFAACLTVTDKDGNELLKNEANLRPFTSVKLNVADLVDLSTITDPGVYNINLTLTDDANHVRHTASTPFTLVALEGSIELLVGSTTNSDLIYTEGEAFDLGLIMKKTDGIAEAFQAVLTITDKNGNKLKEKTVSVPAKLEVKASVNDLIDLSDLPATGSFNLNIVMVDAAGNERANLDTIFHRVKIASIKSQVKTDSNPDNIFIDGDPMDLKLYVQKTDGIDEKLHVKYTVFNANNEEIAGREADANVASGSRYLTVPLEDIADLTEHGMYNVHVLITDNSGFVRSEYDTKFVRIGGGDIRHQVSGSSTGTKMQFTPGMKIDLCLFVQKLDGIPESLPNCYLQVTDPSGNVIYSMKGRINVPATGYFKFALPLDGLCSQFGTYKVYYTMTDDAGNLRVSNTAAFRVISPSGDMAVAVKSASNKPGMIYSRDEAFDLVLYIQKADGVEQTLPVRYTISDMNGLVLETKEGKLTLPATGYRKIPIELPDLDAFNKYGVFNMKVEVAGVDGKLIFSENYSFSRVLTPEKQLDVMGVCTHLAKKGMSGVQSQQYVDLARQAGISFWRDELPWSTVEPTKGTYYFPAICDTAVDYTLSIGLEPLFILDYGNNNYGSDVTTDEWLEGYLGYVEAMVTHFKGRIKYYEVWNEWNIGLGGMDKKYRDYPELYARILIPTYKLIKEIDPTITVIGGVVAGGDEEWTEALLQCEGAIDAMDVFSYHEYPDNDVAEFVEQAEKIRALLTKYGRPDIPMWVSETGFPTHVGRNSFTEEVSAGNLVSMYTWAIANPDVLDQIFWYDLHNDGVERENGEHNFGLLRNWNVDDEPVPMAAKPSYVALCAMNSILVDAEFVEEFDMGHKNITAYRFKKDGKDLLVAWADDKALNMVATVGENNIIVTDMYGNASALDPVDGKVSLFFSDAPIYIEYDLSQKLEMVEGGFTLDKDQYTATPAAVFPVKITRDNGLEGQSGSYAFSMPETWSVEGIEFGAAEAGATEIIDTVYVTVGDDAAKGEMTITARAIIGGNVVGQFNVPIEMGDICTVNPDVVFTENGAEFKVSVQILNENSTKPLSGTINLLAPEELLGEASSIPFDIPAGENKAVLIDVPAEYANTYHTVKVEVVLGSGAKHEVTKPMSFLYAIEAPENMKLDGVIDEQWDGAMEFTIGEEDWFNDVSYDTEWTGNTAKGYAMWDKDYLYVAVEVHDASHYQVGSGASIWMGDSIQMTTDVSRFTVPAYYGYNEIGYSLNSENGDIENWNWFASPGKNVSAGGIFKIIRDDEAQTTTYEVALPWSELLPNEVEFDFRSLGFALIVNENSIDEEGDPTGRTGWIEYMSGIGYRKEPEKFGDLILVERSEIQ